MASEFLRIPLQGALTLMADPVVSIVVDSYNYGRFLRQAIDSALNQTYPNVEVIVVDDGSSDESPQIIASYGNRIVPLLKQNAGQGSAFNAGFKLSRGEIVCFLDSDDFLAPTAVSEACKRFDHASVAHVHWPLWEIDGHDKETGQIIPGEHLPEGDFRAVMMRDGPGSSVVVPTTGNAWSRSFLSKVLPMPEPEFRLHPDTYLVTLAAIYGITRAVREPQGYSRVHGANFSSKPAEEKNRRNLPIYHHQCAALSQHLRQQGIALSEATWKDGNSYYDWMQKEMQATEEMKSVLPSGTTFILVDDGHWAEERGGADVVADRRSIPFLEKDGQYWGPPDDDGTAIHELERLHRAGASFLVFAWPAFWWLDHYSGLNRHVRDRFRCVLESDRLAVFDLRGV